MYGKIKDDLSEVAVSNSTTTDLGVISTLMDDLNTPGLIAELNKIVKEYNSSEEEREITKEKLILIGSVLGILQDESFNNISDELRKEVEELILLRDKAKGNKDYDAADKIREELLNLGIEIKDTSNGTDWKLKS